jgi:transposase
MDKLSHIWQRIQGVLFPFLEEELGPMTAKEKRLVEILELVRIEDYVPSPTRSRGRPATDRQAIGRAFVAKAFYNLGRTTDLIEQLNTNANFRRICGFESKGDIPDESTFSRAFADLAKSKISEIAHEDLVKEHLSEELIGHISRDSTAIEAREKPARKTPKSRKEKKRGRPKKGEVKEPKEETVLEKQATQTLPEMLQAMPTVCDVGSKKNSSGHIMTWNGYKLHIDTADCGVPISCLLTSASVHDSQAALPLSLISAQRVTNCYDLMDSAYDSPIIRNYSKDLGHVAIIDINPRRNKELKNFIESENKCARILNFEYAEKIRYNERSGAERTNARVKDEFGGKTVRVKGPVKVMAHLMFGILVLAADQLLRLVC